MRSWLKKKKDGSRSPIPPRNPASPATATQTPSPSTPQPAELFRAKGDELAGKGDYNSAIVMYNTALEHAPDDFDLLLSRSLAHTMSDPEYFDLALKDADEAIRLRPRNAQVWSQKGEVLMRIGYSQRAIEALTNAVGFAQPHERFATQRALAAARAQVASSQTSRQLSPQPSQSTGSNQIPQQLSPQSSPNPAGGQVPQQRPQQPSQSPRVPQQLSPHPSPSGGGSQSPQQLSPRPSQSTPGSEVPQQQPHRPSPQPSPQPPLAPSQAPSTTASPVPTSTPLSSVEDRMTSSMPPQYTRSAPSVPTATTPDGISPTGSSPQSTRQSTQTPSDSVKDEPGGTFSIPLRSTRSPPPSATTTTPGAVPTSSNPSNPEPPHLSTQVPPYSAKGEHSGSVSTLPRSHGSPQGATTTTTPDAVPPTNASPQPASGQSNRTQGPADMSQGTSTTSPNPTPSNRNQQTQPNRAPAVNRQSTSASNAIPQGLLEDLNTPDVPPPAYTENFRVPLVVEQKIRELEQALKVKNKGSLSIRPYTTAGSIDAIRLLYVGMTQNELTGRELGTPTYLHPNFADMCISVFDYPGNTFLDLDCEISALYEGKIHGTVTVNGHSEEYRTQQLRIAPLVTMALLGTSVLPEIKLSTVIERLRRLQRSPSLEDHPDLARLLGLSQVAALQNGFYTGGSRQKQIEYICMALNNSQEKARSRFPDLANTRNISTYVVGNLSSGTGLRNFLYQILLGCELLVRLRKEPTTTSYAGLMRDSTSALLVLGQRWMSSVTMTGPSYGTAVDSPNSYTFISHTARSQAEALIRFGEALRWPFMDEARNWIETTFSSIASGSQTCNADVWDWFFNMVLPGQVYRHRIMAALVHASPSVRELNGAPFYENGLAVYGRSYWPKRTVLGRVLGGVSDVKSVCGWIGPLPAPRGNMTGWIRLSARSVTIPVPVKAPPGEDALSELGFDDYEPSDRYTLLEKLFDPNEWVEIMAPTRPPGSDVNQSTLKAINLTKVPADPATSTAFPDLPSEQYRASLDLEINGVPVKYTLYANPVFVAAPPCVGSHVLHKNQGQKYLQRVVRVQDLKSTDPTLHELLIINALAPGEEVVARAWCAERARNAVIRRGGECCFACATNLTIARKGLGFNVLILSK